ncbi:hypothetical protein FKM82_025469 [Ascaphus truei]
MTLGMVFSSYGLLEDILFLWWGKSPVKGFDGLADCGRILPDKCTEDQFHRGELSLSHTETIFSAFILQGPSQPASPLVD